MRSLKSLTGVLQMPEIKVNFYLSFDEPVPEGEAAKNTGEEEPEGEAAKNTGEEEPKGEAAKKIGRVLDQFSNLSPQMQEVIIEFAEYLEKKGGKPGGQGPTT